MTFVVLENILVPASNMMFDSKLNLLPCATCLHLSSGLRHLRLVVFVLTEDRVLCRHRLSTSRAYLLFVRPNRWRFPFS
jgi:hypothetical protein